MKSQVALEVLKHLTRDDGRTQDTRRKRGHQNVRSRNTNTSIYNSDIIESFLLTTERVDDVSSRLNTVSTEARGSDANTRMRGAVSGTCQNEVVLTPNVVFCSTSHTTSSPLIAYAN